MCIYSPPLARRPNGVLLVWVEIKTSNLSLITLPIQYWRYECRKRSFTLVTSITRSVSKPWYSSSTMACPNFYSLNIHKPQVCSLPLRAHSPFVAVPTYHYSQLAHLTTATPLRSPPYITRLSAPALFDPPAAWLLGLY